MCDVIDMLVLVVLIDFLVVCSVFYICMNVYYDLVVFELIGIYYIMRKFNYKLILWYMLFKKKMNLEKKN